MFLFVWRGGKGWLTLGGIFFVLQTAAKAIDFYNDKVKDLDTNLQDLEKIVQGKSANLRVIEDGEFRCDFFLGFYLAMRGSHAFLFVGDG